MLYKPPVSDISVEKLYVKARKFAKQSVSSNELLTEAAKAKYIDANGNIVGVVGQAGIGKTTLTKVLLKRVISDERLYDADFVFYCQFQDFVYDEKTDFLRFLAKGFTASWMDRKPIRNAVLNRLSLSKVCIIMDGFDESNLRSEVKSVPVLCHDDVATAADFIWNIFQGNIFPKAKKLITSRPRQLFQLPTGLRPSFLVNILGLDTEAQKEVCQDVCGKNCDFVFNYTQDHPDISSYCYVPINCILVMHCINYLSHRRNCAIPTTLTGILVVVLCLFIDSPQVRKHFKFKLKSLMILAELAWNGFMTNRFYFNESDLEKAGFQKEQLNTFFITILGKNKLSFFNGLSPKHTYFSHLLWQEFFVAIKLVYFVTPEYFQTTFFKNTKAKDSDVDISEQIQFDFTQSRFEVVSKFVFGLCNVITWEYLHEKFPDLPQFPSVQAELLRNMALENLPDTISASTFQVFLQTCTWINEMHDECFTKTIADKISQEIVVHQGEILPSDIAGFHHFIRNRSEPISLSFGILNGENGSDNFQVRFPGESLMRFFKEMHQTIQSSSVRVSGNTNVLNMIWQPT